MYLVSFYIKSIHFNFIRPAYWGWGLAAWPLQETQYTMLEIEQMISKLGLRWVQMAETVSEAMHIITTTRDMTQHINHTIT